jgi:hypothetical protein
VVVAECAKIASVGNDAGGEGNALGAGEGSQVCNTAEPEGAVLFSAAATARRGGGGAVIRGEKIASDGAAAGAGGPVAGAGAGVQVGGVASAAASVSACDDEASGWGEEEFGGEEDLEARDMWYWSGAGCVGWSGEQGVDVCEAIVEAGVDEDLMAAAEAEVLAVKVDDLTRSVDTVHRLPILGAAASGDADTPPAWVMSWVGTRGGVLLVSGVLLSRYGCWVEQVRRCGAIVVGQWVRRPSRLCAWGCPAGASCSSRHVP